MTWQLERLQVTLQTPVHCGDRPMGFVAKTLPYIPGHIPLMAMVPIIVRDMNLKNTSASYKSVLDFLQKHVRFTPFFLVDKAGKELIPYHKSILNIIQNNWISSSYGVAISYPTRGAKEGHLFEIEAISPIGKNGAETKLQGYVFWKDPQQLDAGSDGGTKLKLDSSLLKAWINKSQWGGERSKGYGKIKHVGGQEDQTLWEQSVELDGANPMVVWPENKHAPFNLLYLDGVNDKTTQRDDMASIVNGEIKPQVGREYDETMGFGQKSSIWKLIWEVGWLSSKTLKIALTEKSVAESTPV